MLGEATSTIMLSQKPAVSLPARCPYLVLSAWHWSLFVFRSEVSAPNMTSIHSEAALKCDRSGALIRDLAIKLGFRSYH